MATVVRAVGASIRPDMAEMDIDWATIDALQRACAKLESVDTFFPFFQTCGICHGFIFGCDEADINKQFGCCGCVVAMEMELLAAGIRPPPSQPAILLAPSILLEATHQARTQALVEMALSKTLTAQREPCHHHRKGLGPLKERGSCRGRLVKTRQSLTRSRPPQLSKARTRGSKI